MSKFTVNFHSLHYYHSFGLSTPTVYLLIMTRASPRTTRSVSLLLASLIVVVYTSCLFLNLVIFHVCLVLSIRIRYTAQSGLLFFLNLLVILNFAVWYVLICYFPDVFLRPLLYRLPPSPCCAAQRKGFFFFKFSRGLAVVLTLTTVRQPTAVLFEFVTLCVLLSKSFLTRRCFWTFSETSIIFCHREEGQI